MTNSLKARLIYGMILSTAILLITFDLIIYHTIRTVLFNQFDTGLESAANIMSASVEFDENEVDFEFNSDSVPEFTGKKTNTYYELRQSNGELIKKSSSLGNDNLIWINSASPKVFKTFKMKNHRYRAIVINFVPKKEKNQTTNPPALNLTVARSVRNLLSHLEFLKYLLIFTTAGIIFITCVIASIVVTKGIKPLSAFAAQINNIRDDNLKTRIGGEILPQEIEPIKKQLNNLLERLEISFERERVFNANVAHELRTPIAGIKSIIDVSLTRERDAKEYRDALLEGLNIVNDMDSMISKLLMIAKIESGQMKPNIESVNIAELVEKCWKPFSDKAISSGIIFENNLDKTLAWNTDQACLSIIFSNLLNNAAEYTNNSGRIWVTSQNTDNGIEIFFENTGNHLTQEQIQTIFDYYSRGDKARSNTGLHSGLGLALTKRIIELMSGSIKADTPNGLFRIRVFLRAI